MPTAEVRLELVALQPGDRVTGLSCGNNEFVPLKTFFQKHAKRYEEDSLARTYVMRKQGESRAIAYITLVCGEILTEDGNPLIGDGIEYPYNSYPAVKIARLFVDSRDRCSDLQIGTKLVDYALGVTKDKVCPAAGCRFMVVDAKKASVGFYEKRGFTLLNTADNKKRDEPIMFIDLRKAAEA